MSNNKLREALEKFCAIDLSGLKFPLDGDSSAIYNSDRKEITIPYWRVAELLNEVKAAKDMAKAALDEPVRNCDVGTAEEQADRFYKFCARNSSNIVGMCSPNCPCITSKSRCHCLLKWAQMPYEKEGEE